MSDTENSPGQRLALYRAQVAAQAVARVMHLAALCEMFMCTCILMMDRDLSAVGAYMGGVCLVPVMLLSGDIYERVRDFVEQRVYCPRYDRASQERPKVQVEPNRIEVIDFRCAIYMVVTPLLPTVMLVLAQRFGLVHVPLFVGAAVHVFGLDPRALLPLILGSWFLALVFSLIFGSLRAFYYPTTLRSMLQPFRPVPGPDLH